MLTINRETAEVLHFEVWQESDGFEDYDMENLVAGVTFPKVSTLLLGIDCFRQWPVHSLTKTKSMCSRVPKF